jgi:putative ABC transport system permease protein
MRLWALRELRVSAGRYLASVTVVAVVAAFAVLLLESIEVFIGVLERSGISGTGLVRLALLCVGFVFLGIAVLTSAIVISGTFATVYAGRLKDIALLRLVGATSRQVRRASRVDGLAVGVTGTVSGITLGIAVAGAAIATMNTVYGAGLSFVWSAHIALVPAGVCIAVSVFSASSGARRVARVSPAEATRSDAASTKPPAPLRRRRRTAGMVLFVVGIGFMGLGLVAGLSSPVGLLIAFPGGASSILGVIIAAPAFTEPIVAALSGRFRGRGEYVLAGANLRLNSVRTARTIVSVLIGVTLITMFTVAGEMYLAQLRTYFGDAVQIEQVGEFVTMMLIVVYVLTSFSVLVAAIGFGSNLTMSVIQRRREIAVLRSLGLTTSQVRRMILVESVVVAVIGATLGLALGVLYGFVGANATFGVQGFTAPVLSPWFLLAVISGAVIFSVLASILPGRGAARITPSAALREV